MADKGIQSWKSLALGCAMTKPGTSKQFNTGDWRSRRYPITDYEKCIKCGICYTFCPDMCYTPDIQTEGPYTWNSFYCKGCGICIYECPKQAISWQEEEEKEDQYGPTVGS